MARYPIYASDFGQLGNQLQQEEIMQQRANEEAQRNFMRSREQQQQQSNFDRQMAYRQALDREAFNRQAQQDALNERWMNWQMSPEGARSRIPAAAQTDILRTAIRSAEEDGIVPDGLPEEFRPHVEEIAKQARPRLAQQHELLSGAAEVVNRRNALRRAIQRLDADIGAEPKRESLLFGNFLRSGSAAITKKLKTMRDAYAKELAVLEPQAKMVESDPTFADGLQLDPRTRSFRPIYVPGFMQTNAPAATGTNAPARRAAMPSGSATNGSPKTANPYVVGARYGDLRYNGGDPYSESSWTPVR